MAIDGISMRESTMTASIPSDFSHASWREDTICLARPFEPEVNENTFTNILFGQLDEVARVDMDAHCCYVAHCPIQVKYPGRERIVAA